VERTLASLSLREKVGQLIMPWTGGEYVPVDSPEFDRLREWVERDGVGGLIISIGLPHSYAAKLNELQRRAKVPLLIASDMENGPGMRLSGIYTLPHLLPQGGGSDSLAREVGRVTGREARAVGVHLTFGPVLDVNSNPLNPIINTRSFGEDPALVSRLAAAWIAGAQSARLLTTGKHFPGHGDTEVDSHIGLPAISADRARLEAVELPPFRAAIRAGTDAMLVAHIALTGVEGDTAPPATLSPALTTRMLRDELGFQGLVVTDAMTMGGVTQRYGAADALVRALEAGADILLMPRDVGEAIQTVMTAVQAGRIAETRIDASVRRILTAKARAGLPQRHQVNLDSVDHVVGIRAHTELARRVAERSITLARDRRNLVPLSAGARRILVVSYADVADLVAGRAFSRTLMGPGRRVDAVRVDDRTTPAEFKALAARADSADVVIAAAYVQPREYKGSVGAGGGFAGWTERLATRGKPLIALSFGTPYLLPSFPSVPAYLLAWSGVEASQEAAARALLGQLPITGRLPISIPPFHRAGEGIQRPARIAKTP
jgi:beta-N-acetylhexosaminidase